MDSRQQILFFAALVAVFTVKQTLADFPLQTNWMARGKERAQGWSIPLAAHAGVHALFTLLIVCAAVPRLWWLSLVDFVVHGAIDRGKALISRRTGWIPQDAHFWTLFGLDQMLHHLTGLGLVLALSTA